MYYIEWSNRNPDLKMFQSILEEDTAKQEDFSDLCREQYLDSILENLTPQVLLHEFILLLHDCILGSALDMVSTIFQETEVKFSFLNRMFGYLFMQRMKYLRPRQQSAFLNQEQNSKLLSGIFTFPKLSWAMSTGLGTVRLWKLFLVIFLLRRQLPVAPKMSGAPQFGKSDTTPKN